MIGSLVLLLVLPFLPGAAPLMCIVMVAASIAAGVFAGLGMYGDSASALLVLVYAAMIYALRHLRLRFGIRRMIRRRMGAG